MCLDDADGGVGCGGGGVGAARGGDDWETHFAFGEWVCF